VVTGGAFDVDPSYYGGGSRHATVITKDRRTAFEFAVTRGAFVIRSSRTGTASLLSEAQQAIWSANGRQPVFLVRTLKTLYDQSMATTSFTLVMLAIAGGMAFSGVCRNSLKISTD